VVQTKVEYTTARGPAQERRDKITSALERGPLDADAIAGEVGTVKSTILGDLEMLRGAGRVTRSGAGRKGDPYIFSLSAFVR
jgi:predicted ArsR family transcriptional regulator